MVDEVAHEVSSASDRGVAAPASDRSRWFRDEGGSGGRPREHAEAVERAHEVGEERVAGLQAQDESSAAAADGGGDGDEAEAQPLGVASPLARGRASSFSQRAGCRRAG